MTDYSGHHIELEGVQTNNLKNVDVKLPLGALTVVTGVSGSGKSSLVFDTLYSESYRRYVESLSSFARQYLKALPKPKMLHAKNLPPAIAVRQFRSGATSRSTVGTVTELNDLLRILYAHLATIECTQCGRAVIKHTPETIAAAARELFADQRVMIGAPLHGWKTMKAKELRTQLEAQGFSRAYAAQSLTKLADIDLGKLHAADVIIDRIQVESAQEMRLSASAGLALKAGRGRCVIIGENDQREEFMAAYCCPHCDLEYEEPSPALLSFNHPLGACVNCQGFGYAAEIDWDKVFPDHDSSLSGRGVVPWNFGSHVEIYERAKTSARKIGVAAAKPFKSYAAAEWEWLKNGDDGKFKGVRGYFKWLEEYRHKTHYRIHAAKFRKYVLCPVCHGKRLNTKALACKLLGQSLADICSKSIDQVRAWIAELEAAKTQVTAMQQSASSGIMGLEEAVDEAKARLGYLQKIGVAYLALDRQTRTLSGGEMQRISMARCLGSALTETLYCLDEPTSGLHARDSSNLLEIVKEMRDQGNTVVVVEHEKVVIRGADYLIEIGPQAGHKGGEVVFAGRPLTAKKREQVTWPETGKQARDFTWIELKGASTHNLRAIDVKFPVGALTAVCGVSGSGKTSLIQHTLYPLLAKVLGSEVEGIVEEPRAKSLGPASVIKRFSTVMHVSQAALGRSTRSNIATYLGIFDEIRKLLAATDTAKANKLTPGHFSFNTPGGRCENCRGLGTVVADLSFLGEMAVICAACQGARFDQKVLQVEYKGKNLIDILRLTVAEAREFFYERAALAKLLDNVIEMGLGYVTLGQSTSSFSGGEAQRLKLLRLMKEAHGGKPAFLIFDEPTTGLSDTDVMRLLEQLRYLTSLGHTVIVVEHHLGVLRSADWLIEIGPEAAAAGGQVVYQGVPADIKQNQESVTARYLFN